MFLAIPIGHSFQPNEIIIYVQIVMNVLVPKLSFKYLTYIGVHYTVFHNFYALVKKSHSCNLVNLTKMKQIQTWISDSTFRMLWEVSHVFEFNKSSPIYPETGSTEK